MKSCCYSVRVHRVASDHLPADESTEPKSSEVRTALPETWHGWLWTGRPLRWAWACRAPSMEECSRLLGVEGQRRGVPCRLQCMTRGAVPSARPTTVGAR
jgi:hypothetical protein